MTEHRGRNVITSKTLVPNKNGRAKVFHAEFDPNATLIHPEIEKSIRNIPDLIVRAYVMIKLGITAHSDESK